MVENPNVSSSNVDSGKIRSSDTLFSSLQWAKLGFTLAITLIHFFDTFFSVKEQKDCHRNIWRDSHYLQRVKGTEVEQ